MRSSRSRTISTSQNGDTLNKRISGSCRSLERLTRGPGRVSVWSDKITKQIPPPFRGGLSSQMICEGCGFKSVVRLDKFESITLNLPEIKVQGLSLGQLLTEFVAPETLQEVNCEHCNKQCQHTRQLTFGKLPSCLCVHISRYSYTIYPALPTLRVSPGDSGFETKSPGSGFECDFVRVYRKIPTNFSISIDLKKFQYPERSRKFQSQLTLK
jgi:hypothetical protein